MAEDSKFPHIIEATGPNGVEIVSFVKETVNGAIYTDLEGELFWFLDNDGRINECLTVIAELTELTNGERG